MAAVTISQKLSRERHTSELIGLRGMVAVQNLSGFPVNWRIAARENVPALENDLPAGRVVAALHKQLCGSIVECLGTVGQAVSATQTASATQLAVLRAGAPNAATALLPANCRFRR